ncbi:MAG: PepSY-associated TM helix domain-containing protein [Pseudomonadota bacterium]
MNKDSSKKRGLNKQLWAIHSWVGLYAGVVIATLSLTGVTALFIPEIDRLINGDKFHVEPSGPLQPVAGVIEQLAEEHGPENLLVVFPPTEPDDTWLLRFFQRDGIHVSQPDFFIDPYAAEVIAERDYMRSLAHFLRQIHVRLFESQFGRQIVGIAGIALLLSTLTGFLIYGRFMKKQLFGAIRAGKPRVVLADWHKLIGVATLAFNLMIAITGAWLGLQVYLQPVLVGDRPGAYRATEKPLEAEADAAFVVNYDEVLTTSRALFPELVPKVITPSRDGARTLRVAGDIPGQAYERNSFILTLDKEDLSEVHRYDIRQAGAGAKLFYLQESMHFGDYGGLLLKFVYAFFGLTSGFLSLAGFVVYLERTAKKRREKPRFRELKPTLLRWTYGILGTLVLLAGMQMALGPVIPYLLVTVTFYGWLLFLLLRQLGRFVRSRVSALRAS